MRTSSRPIPDLPNDWLHSRRESEPHECPVPDRGPARLHRGRCAGRIRDGDPSDRLHPVHRRASARHHSLPDVRIDLQGAAHRDPLLPAHRRADESRQDYRSPGGPQPRAGGTDSRRAGPGQRGGQHDLRRDERLRGRRLRGGRHADHPGHAEGRLQRPVFRRADGSQLDHRRHHSAEHHHDPDCEQSEPLGGCPVRGRTDSRSPGRSGPDAALLHHCRHPQLRTLRGALHVAGTGPRLLPLRSRAPDPGHSRRRHRERDLGNGGSRRDHRMHRLHHRQGHLSHAVVARVLLGGAAGRW